LPSAYYSNGVIPQARKWRILTLATISALCKRVSCFAAQRARQSPGGEPAALVVGGAPFSPILESDKAVKLIASVRLQTNDARFAAWQQATAVRIG